MKKYIRKNRNFLISVCLLLAIMISMIVGQTGLVVRAETLDPQSVTEQEATERSTEWELTEVQMTETESDDSEMESNTESVENESEGTETENIETENTETENNKTENTEIENTEEELSTDTEDGTDSGDDTDAENDADTETEGYEIFGSNEGISSASDENGISAASDENGISVASDENGISLASDENGISVASDEPGILTASAATQVSGTLNMSSYNSGGSIILTGNTTANGQCQLSGDLEIDLNGYDLTMSSGSYFMINGGNLTIRDSTASQSGTIWLSTYLVWFYGGGTFTFESGVIDGSTQTSKPQHGGAVYMYTSNQKDSVFYMTGGTIQNCSSTQYGGAVYVGPAFSGYTSTFRMSGGKITGCESRSGGAIYIDGGKVDESQNGSVYLSGHVIITGNNATAVSTTDTSSDDGDAIYQYGNLYIEGYLDIDGTVYLSNEWAGNGLHYIVVTGELCLLGDGYIDVYTTYYTNGYVDPWNSSYAPEVFGSGYTVVSNQGNIDSVTFYPYKEYFYNTKKNMGVTAGWHIIDQAWTSTNHWLKYTDVMGVQWNVTDRSLSVTSSDFQTEDYLIYAGISSTSQLEEISYYSIQMRKYDADSNSLLDGATFTLYQADSSGSTSLTVDGVNVSVNQLQTCTSGSVSEVGTGLAYFMDANQNNAAKLMLTDGTYYIVETAAPTGYDLISTVITIVINGDTVTVTGNKESGSTGSYYSYTLTTAANEIVLSAYDAADEPEPVTITLTGIKYGTSVIDGNQLAGAVYSVYAADDTAYTTPLGTAASADGTGSEAKGTLTFLDTAGDAFVLTAGNTYILHEVTAPTGYVTGEDIKITISEDGTAVTLTQGSKTLTVYTGTTTEGVSYYTWEQSANTLALYLTDETLYSLPGTNGAGIYRGMAMGILLMCLTGLGILCLRRKQQY